MSVRQSLMLRAWLTAAALCMGSCSETPNRPPVLTFVPDQTVVVTEGLRLPLVANDPDDDPLTFEISGLPLTARVVEADGYTALLYWNPVSSNTEPGGRIYTVTLTVRDGRGGSAAQTFQVDLRHPSGEPEIDLPAGVVLNLAVEDDVAIIVAAKDNDSSEVSLTLLEAPDGAKFQSAGPKAAYFYWQPSAEQREVVVHRAVFSAQDETHAAVRHELTIVLLNPEDAAGCDGTPPTIRHTVAGDTVLDDTPSTLPLFAEVVDGDSAISSVYVEWSLDDGDVTVSPMNETEQGYELALPLESLSLPGQLLHYAVVATDNDDTTGSGCDRQSRSPKSGWHTVAVYPTSAPAGSCVDDASEPDSDPSAPPILAPGAYFGRRVCGKDRDYALIDAAPLAYVAVAVTHDPQHGEMALRLLDTDLNLIDEATSGSGLLSVGSGGDGPYIVEIEGLGPKPQFSYSMVITAEEVSCEPDAFEPNDEVDQAVPVDAAVVSAAICPGDEDWYRFDLSAGESLAVTCTFAHAYGDLDMELIDEDGVTVIASSAGETSAEKVAVVAEDAMTVFVRVVGHEGVGNVYSLVTERGISASDCPEDILGVHDSWQAAVTLFQGVYENLVACPDRSDWFAVDLNGGETLYVLIEVPPGEDWEVRLYSDPEQPPVVVETPDATGLAIASTTIDVAGRWFYEVVATDSDAGSYALYQDVEDPAGPCAPDRFEPNDSEGEASPLVAGVTTWLRLCGSEDVDGFIVYDLPPFASLDIFTSHAAGLGYTDVQVWNPAGELVADVIDYDIGAEVSVLAELPGAYRIVITPYDVVDGLPYDLAVLTD